MNVCVYCGRVGSRGFVLSSGTMEGPGDTWRCANQNACDRRQRLNPLPSSEDLLARAIERRYGSGSRGSELRAAIANTLRRERREVVVPVLALLERWESEVGWAAIETDRHEYDQGYKRAWRERAEELREALHGLTS